MKSKLEFHWILDMGSTAEKTIFLPHHKNGEKILVDDDVELDDNIFIPNSGAMTTWESLVTSVHSIFLLVTLPKNLLKQIIKKGLQTSAALDKK